MKFKEMLGSPKEFDVFYAHYVNLKKKDPGTFAYTIEEIEFLQLVRVVYPAIGAHARNFFPGWTINNWLRLRFIYSRLGECRLSQTIRGYVNKCYQKGLDKFSFDLPYATIYARMEDIEWDLFTNTEEGQSMHAERPHGWREWGSAATPPASKGDSVVRLSGESKSEPKRAPSMSNPANSNLIDSNNDDGMDSKHSSIKPGPPQPVSWSAPTQADPKSTNGNAKPLPPTPKIPVSTTLTPEKLQDYLQGKTAQQLMKMGQARLATALTLSKQADMAAVAAQAQIIFGAAQDKLTPPRLPAFRAAAPIASQAAPEVKYRPGVATAAAAQGAFQPVHESKFAFKPGPTIVSGLFPQSSSSAQNPASGKKWVKRDLPLLPNTVPCVVINS
ncbi:MAG TPA: hypothetical protein VMA71_06640 [Alloacidobacterium sp.]|nr:hypothetical protein [Alloacidobacterium sp.]